jgi:hypothetical protein
MARETLPFLLVAHNAHASGAGTNVQVGKPAQRPFRSEQVGNFAATDTPEIGAQESLL